MVLLEIATLITAGWGLADYYHTKVYSNNLRKLKEKYGEHPNIDEAFEDICTLGGETFEMPTLVLDKENPHINMGSFYPISKNGPAKVLQEFFLTYEERMAFYKKYDEEVQRQRNLRNDKLARMYEDIVPLYESGNLANMGKTRLSDRIFESRVMIAKSREYYDSVLKHMCENTIWGDIIEAGPGKVIGDEYHFISTWLIKEDIFKEIHNKETLNLLFDCCYYHFKHYDW